MQRIFWSYIYVKFTHKLPTENGVMKSAIEIRKKKNKKKKKTRVCFSKDGNT